MSDFSFPADWTYDERKSNTKKRRKTENSLKLQAHAEHLELPECTELSSTVKEILNIIHSTRVVPTVPAELNLDVILSHTSFHDLLTSLFHKVCTTS